MSDLLRILDANLNRAREAVRVMEDAARFVLDDRALAAALKELRHELGAASAELARRAPLEAARDVGRDVGRTLETASERRRADLAAVTIAAGKRLGEALRSLEEFGKLVDETFAGRAKALRYRGYALEQQLVGRLRPTPEVPASGVVSGGGPGSRGLGGAAGGISGGACDGARGPFGGGPPARPAAAPQWRLCVLVAPSLAPRPWESLVEAVIDGGADAIQLRDKALGDRDLLDAARRLVAIAAGRAASIVNDRLDIALAAGASGVHIGRGDLPISEARRLAGGRLLIGASTHSMDEAVEAVGAGADGCGVGTMFPSRTRPDLTLSGAAFLRAFVAAFPGVPHLAIGGIDLDRLDGLIAAGCRGVAVGDAIAQSEEPGATARAFVERLRAAERGT
ncbi:MAG TPA: thiamine phosphate synthase [Phycisphaerales bacterium]|nr:thiamine phosphate synthase [Phycisphaerales bacterium]HMP36761.1 thiamine phosphate synthase [Phycisphaerales bacterium]